MIETLLIGIDPNEFARLEIQKLSVGVCNKDHGYGSIMRDVARNDNLPIFLSYCRSECIMYKIGVLDGKHCEFLCH